MGADPSPPTAGTEMRLQLLTQVAQTIWRPGSWGEEEVQAKLLSVAQRLGDIDPTDAVEAMLAAQMIATHEAAMECLRRSVLGDQTLEGRDLNLKNATKLMSLYERQVAALDKHRGRGQQKVTVKYVHVSEGGQAIVGNVAHTAAAAIARAGTRPALDVQQAPPLDIAPPRPRARVKR